MTSNGMILHEDVFHDKDHRQYHQGWIQTLESACEGIEDHIRDNSQENAVRDGTCHRHEEQRNKARQAFFVMGEIYLCDVSEHHKTYDDEHG